MMPPEDADSHDELAAPSPAELEALIPHYEVGALIAQGGMGAVYRGVQSKLDRPVAIKVLPKEHGADLDYAARFEREAKAMAKLSHNNIVGVYDYGETSDSESLYFIMEFVEGTNLYSLLLEGGVGYDQGLSILMQICDALAYAHENGIVHRDIKPANILIDAEGTVKMADFGLAKMQRGGGGADDEEEVAIGTPDYFAPETLEAGVVVDHRADIYSLGVVMYEVLTGEIPKGRYELPSKLNPDIDRRFDEIIPKALAPDRNARYANVREIRSVLGEIAKTPRLKVGGGAGNTGAVPTMAVAAEARGGTVTARKQVQPVPQESSGAGGMVAVLLGTLAVVGGALYWFVFRDTADQTQLADAGTAPAQAEEVTIESSSASQSTRQGETRMELGEGSVEGADAGDPDRKGNSNQAEGGDAKTASTDASVTESGSGVESKEGVMSDKETAPAATEIPEKYRGRAGRLRIEGTNSERKPITAERAEGVTDIIAIRARNSQWSALRANGEIVSRANDTHGMTDVSSLDGRLNYQKIIRNDGTVWNNARRQSAPEGLTEAVQGVAGYGFSAVRLKDGRVKMWGPRYESPQALIDPPVPISGAVDIASNQDCLAIVEASGRAVCIGKDFAHVREPQSDGDRVVDIEGGVFHFVALTKSGEVFTFGSKKIENPKPAPEALGPAIAVRASHNTYAAQRPDGTWFAWGNNPNGIVDKINRLAPTPDIAFAGVKRDDEWGYVAWIEPVSGETTSFAAAGSVDARIGDIQGKYRREYDAMAQGPFDHGLRQIDGFYLSALGRGATEAEAAGDDATAKSIGEALDAATKAVDAASASDGPPPLLVGQGDDQDSGAPGAAKLEGMRKTYLDAVRKLRGERAVVGDRLLHRYVAELATLEAEIGREFGPIRASKVRSLREQALQSDAEAVLGRRSRP